MRAIDILLAPRYATSASSRWAGAGLYVALAIGALASGVGLPHAHGVVVAAMLYALGAALLWWLWLSSLLLVARDGRRQRLPGVVRSSVYAACLYAAATVAVPALFAGMAGANVAIAILWPALGVAACLAWLLLPRWLGMWVGFLPAIYIGMHEGLGAPSWFDARFQAWAWLALAVLVVIDVVRWRHIARGEDNDDSRWSSAMILQMRRHAVHHDWWSIDRNWSWRRSRGRKTEVDFHGVGAANPARAIQVVLGGWYVPQAWRSRASAVALMLLPVLLFIALMWFMNIGHVDSLRKTWKLIGVSGGLWVGGFGAVMLALAVGGLVRRRWHSASDLALLALLPGFGDGVAATRQLLRAVFHGPALGFFVLWLCLLAGVLTVSRSPVALLLATLFVAEMAALTVMASLKVLAGLRMALPTKIALGVILIVLTDGGFVLVSSASSVHWQAAPAAAALTLLGWLVFLAWTIWRARRAWGTLRQRPHPFLADAP